MRYNRILSAFFALMLLLGTMGLSAQSARAQGDVVPSGQTVPAGTIAVWEVVNTPNRTVQVWAGMLPASITTTGSADMAMNAWVNYPDVATAQAGGCQLAASRKAEPFFANFNIQFQDQPFSGQCGQAPSAPTAAPPSTGGPIKNPPWPANLLTPCEGDNVQAVTPGTWMPEGHAAVVREFTWNFGGTSPEVWVNYTDGMPTRLYAGSGYNAGDPLSERAIWHRCDGQSWPNMVNDAYDEASRLLAGSLGFRPKTVYVNGVPFTGTMPGGGAANPGVVKPVVAVPAGTTLPVGRAVIVRAVGSDGAVFIYVERSLKTSLYVSDVFGFAVWSSVDGQPWASMEIDGCGEAVEVIRGGLGPEFRWTTVFLKGERMPTPTCPDP